MNAQELANELDRLAGELWPRLTFEQQAHMAGMITRFNDLAATERFIENAVSNANKELEQMRSLRTRLLG